MPRTFEVVLRNDQVDRAQPGDRVLVTGTLIVVPDAYKNTTGEKYEMSKKINSGKNASFQTQGNQSLQKQGITDLNYKLVFLGNNVVVVTSRFQKHNNIENFERYLQ